MRDLYQKLYTETEYSRGKNCREIRYYERYKDWLSGPITVFGCGSGEGVEFLRKQGHKATGIDWVDLANGMRVADITDPIPNYWADPNGTAICLDVLEHIPPEKVRCVLDNLAKYRRQIVSVNTQPSHWRPEGRDLHLCIKSLDKWQQLIQQHFLIMRTYTRTPEVEKLFMCEKSTEMYREDLTPLQALVTDQKVALIGSVPPEGFPLEDYDVVVRCNDWFVEDLGRCDILFHIGSSPKLKISYLLEEIREHSNLKLCMLYRGAEWEKMKRIFGYQGVDVIMYHQSTEWLKPIRQWFANRGNSPSTGLNALYTLCLARPKKLIYTGANLYANNPKHVGWNKHNPIGHGYWIKKLQLNHPFLELGQDLQAGIDYWNSVDEDFERTGG